MNDGKISVIVPVYGTEKYIDKCLNSILNQTYSNYEVLVVNDASKDSAKNHIWNIATEDALKNFDDESEIANEINDVLVVCIKAKMGKNKANRIYIKIDKEVAEKNYFALLDDFAKELMYEDINSNVSNKYYVVDECLNFEAINKFDISGIRDNVEIEIRKKSYRISSELTAINYIEHFENEGLYQARLTGYEYANGEYITTIDSDDYYGVDYFRLMQRCIEEKQADVVISEMVRENLKTGYKGKRTHAMNAIRGLDLYGEEIADYLFGSEGELSPMWFVWGKLYKKNLWDKCYEDLKTVKNHHIMLEDLMYGTVFTLNAQHYVYCDADTYFYVINDNASTTNNGSSEKLFKNFEDVIYAFEHIEDYLKKKNKYEKYREKFDMFKAKWSRTWFEIQHGYELSEEERKIILEKLEKLSPTGELELPGERDIYFYNNNTPWDNRIEMLKKVIIKKRLISFDIFDTLIVRPFFKPSDLFVLMDEDYKKITKSQVLFSEMRIESEKQARIKLKNSGSQFEDITIEDIYSLMKQIYGISKDVADEMRELEIEYELKFCSQRKKLNEIYELAKTLNKRVVFTSDMYLPQEVVISILEKNGYKYDDNLYLSSEIHLSKTTGRLFETMLSKEGIDAQDSIHIGDNWKSDIEKAKELGMSAWYTPKPIDFLLNKVADINHGKHRGNYGELLYKNITGSFTRYSQALDYLGIRCMLAVIANKIFDNPYADWEADTDFNRNPYNVGYMALGMHEYGIARWLIQNVHANNRIFFVARDGYLAMRIYNVIKEKEKDIPECDYFYMSRKSFLPLSIANVDDWWSIKQNVNYIGKTPEEILEYYKPIVPQYSSTVMESIFSKYGIIYKLPLQDESNYICFVNAIQKELHDQQRIKQYRGQMRKCLSDIFEAGDVMFDIGYSGRAQAILSRLLGYGIDAYYIHILNERALVYAKENNFKVKTFFDYSPALTGKIRELVQSEPVPSCIGYKINDDVLEPVFEDKEWHFHEKYVITQMHNGAEQFVRDLTDTFEGYLGRLVFRNSDISFMHEKFMMLPKKADMEIFRLFHFEDDLFFNKNYEEKWLIDIWSGDLKWNNLPHYSFSHKKKQINQKTSANQSKAIATKEVKKGFSYEPYKLVPQVPDGIKKKIQYFKANDHIVLKKYMSGKGRLQYAMFNALYNAMADTKHRIKGENKVGNKKAEFSLNPNGKLLYNATSAYGLLCCIVHKLSLHPNEPADLMLSSWRKDKLCAVNNSHFFENVIIWSDMRYRDVSYAMDKVMHDATELDKIEQEYRFFSIYEKLIPFKINEYKEIVIAGNSMPFGDFLERNEVEYSIIEDGAGLYCDYSLLQHSIENTYPKIEQYMIAKYKNLQGGKYCKNIFINAKAQRKEYDHSRTVNFAPVELIEGLSPAQRKKIFEIYSVNEAETINRNKACLLLTYPLAQREKFTVNEEKMCYALLADIFGGDCDEIHLKAHPDDRTDFSDIEGLTIVNRNVLSELLWYEMKTTYNKAYATVSTSTNNLLCAEKKTAFDSTFCYEYKYLIRYYVAVILAEYIAVQNNAVINILGDEVYAPLLNAIVIEQEHLKVADNQNADCIISKEVTDRVMDSNMSVILERPLESENYMKVIIRKKRVKKYSFLDLRDEEIYIPRTIEIKKPIVVDMKITGMKIQICPTDYLTELKFGDE